MIRAIAAAALLVLAGCAKDDGQVRVFVCEADGELVEQHVGVASAWAGAAGLWRVDYTDGAAAYYLQKPGETCYTEPQAREAPHG